MLNMKKGLALVLAAATAFTFAPVSTLSANAAATWDDDGLTATTGKIDSIKTLDSFKLTTSGADSTKTLQLAEHQDKVNGVQVKAFRITIDRVVDKNNDNAYHDLVDLDTPSHNVTSSITNSYFENNPTTGSAFSEDKSWGGVANLKKEKSYIVNYTDGAAGGTTPNPKDVWQIGGSLVTFKSACTSDDELIGKTNARSTNVKVEALDSADSSKATVLDSQTFTVNIAVNSVDLSIQAPSDKNQAEGTEIEVPWKLENNGSNGTVDGIYVSADPAQLISATYNSSSNYDSITTHSTPVGTYAGTIKFKTGMQGSVTVTINGYGTKADNSKGVVVSKSFDLNITPGNGKLRVSYTTDSTLAKYKGQKYTFTDDAETNGITTQGIENMDSTTNTVDSEGNYKISAKAVYGADKVSLATSENGTSYIYTNANASSQGSGTTAKKVSEITNAAGQKYVSYYLDETGFLPAAEPVVENGQKTLQITASSDSNAKLSYTLVAPATLHDAVVKTTETTKNSKYSYDSKDYYYNPVTNTFSGSLDGYDVAYANNEPTSDGYSNQAVKHVTNVQAGDYELFSAAEGKKYGAVDSNGLVTLKNANFDVPLYVVITAKASDKTAANAARKTSTFIVPIKTAQLSPLSFYAASEFGAEVDETGIIDSESYNADGKIVLTGDHTSDKLTIDTNAGSAYVTGDVDNKDGKFSYDEATQTVSVNTAKAKDGDSCKLVIKTSSAPDIAGTATATFTVEYHKDWKTTNTLELSDATVSKTSPRDKVVAKTGQDSSVVVFDTNNFYKKANNSRGYEKLKTTDAGYGDVILTSTGWVTYYKNDGDLYVRAYAKKDGFANTKWVYAKVTYGQNATPNDLAVTEDRVVVKPGETAEVHATASTAISFTVDDATVATVASAGSIQVKGLKAGQTTLNVTAAADAKKGISEKTIKIPVVVTGAASNDEVKTPAKVTGVKVTNVKGGKVKVTWTKDSNPNVKYYVKKTVSGKSAGKSVNGNKTTLTVKKGATVKVKVKAYVYDATGKKLVGTYSKTITKKTDKK